MATTVSQSYTDAQNMSVTRKDGVITKVSLWVTGHPASDTTRIV
jgi:hypothetical protein